MRSSYKSVCELYLAPLTPDRKTSEGTKWLDHIKLILSGAIKMARLVSEGNSLLVHCSDGWDRTPQLVSLAELLLDPYYRTIKGFSMLIQKEWVSFGHKFGERSGCGCDDKSSNEISPVFLQWVDAVYQVLVQYPNWFEFNENYLFTLMDAVYDNRFGSFLANSEKERKEKNLDQKTLSFWRHLARPCVQRRVRNAQYLGVRTHFLEPDTGTSLSVWVAYYQRYHIVMRQFHEHEAMSLANKCTINQVKQENEALKQKVEKYAEENSVYEKLFKEQIKNRKDLRDIVREEISKFADEKKVFDSMDFRVVVSKDGSLEFKLEPKAEQQLDSFACKKYCSDYVVIDDYAPNPEHKSTLVLSRIENPIVEDIQFDKSTMGDSTGSLDCSALLTDWSTIDCLIDNQHDNNILAGPVQQQPHAERERESRTYISLSWAKLKEWLGYS